MENKTEQVYVNNEAGVIKTNNYLVSVRTDSIFKSKRYPIRTYANDKKDSVENRKSVFVFRLTDYKDRNDTKSVTFSLDVEMVKRLYSLASGYPLPFKRSGQNYGGPSKEHGGKHPGYYWDISRMLTDKQGNPRNRDIIINAKNAYVDVNTAANGTTQMVHLTEVVQVGVTLMNDEWFSLLSACMEALAAKEAIWANEKTLGVFSAWLDKKLRNILDAISGIVKRDKAAQSVSKKE